MVSLRDMRASNARISSSLPHSPIALFVGATNGIGETTLREFARASAPLSPRVYFVGRSESAGTRIAAECKALAPSGSFTFIQSDLALMRNVDDVCRTITAREKHLNLLWLSQGTLVQGIRTEEDMNTLSALAHFGRVKFMLNLLPLLRAAPGVRRVVSCLAGSKEDVVNESYLEDIQGWTIPASDVHASRGIVASMQTLGMERIADMAPEVSFVHNFPGLVRSGIARGQTSQSFKLRIILNIMYPFAAIPTTESGERNLFVLTSARFPARKEGKQGGDAEGVPIEGVVSVAKGSAGVDGSGVYTIDQHAESGGLGVDKVLEKMRSEGLSKRLWEKTEEELVRTTGRTAI